MAGLAAALPLVLAGSFVLATPASAAATSTAGGFAEGYGLLIDTTLLTGNVPVAVGPLAPSASSCPPATGMKQAEVLGGGDAQVAKADVLDSQAATDCTAKHSKAGAMTLNVDALGALGAAGTVHTDEITTTADVTCSTAPTASTKIVNLSVGGTPVPLPADIPPNFDLLPQLFGPLGVRIILNEQHPAADGRGIVANGLHIIANGSGAVPVGGTLIRGDVVISHASAGVVCPGGPGSALGGLPAPDITFAKSATPTSIHAGDQVTYTATVHNTSTTPCEVLSFIDHMAPPFTLVSTSGAFGKVFTNPPPVRTDGGVDAVLHPTGVTIAPKGSATQTFVVKAKSNAAPGTYYDSLEIYCGVNGNFVSGPLAPVTITAVVTPQQPVVVPPELPHTGGAPVAAAVGGLLLAAALGLARARRLDV
jgi:uncharacterized repeat protein (TIGR01451 family)